MQIFPPSVRCDADIAKISWLRRSLRVKNVSATLLEQFGIVQCFSYDETKQFTANTD